MCAMTLMKYPAYVVAVWMLAVTTLTSVALAQQKTSKRKVPPEPVSPPSLKIIQDALHGSSSYFVKGTIYNPNDKAVKDVVIKYYIWKKWMGKEGHGTVIRDTGGLVVANIKYLPPKQSADYMAVGGDNAPVMTPESGLHPDPLNAEITAEWDQ